MRVAIAGSHGLIGTALTGHLRTSGHEVVRLVRGPLTGGEPVAGGDIRWDPEGAGLPPTAFDGVDAVVNLCGESIGAGRWNDAFKQQVRDSRITPTSVLAEGVQRAGVPVFVSASATGFYGDTGENAVTEKSPAGAGFLATLASEWEAATSPASSARVVTLRTGPVLSREGGMLGRLRRVYKLGLGGSMGSGQQFFSWISMTDTVGAIEHALTDNEISGPMNLTAPQQVRYAEFNQLLAQQLRRPGLFRVPGAVAKLAGGEMARELLLASSRVEPAMLTGTGYVFTHPTLAQALAYTEG